MVFVLAVVFGVSSGIEALPPTISSVQDDCVKVSQPAKDAATDMYVVPLNNTCGYKVKVVVTNGGVNYGKILESAATGQIVLGKAGAKDDYAVTWKKM